MFLNFRPLNPYFMFLYIVKMYSKMSVSFE